MLSTPLGPILVTVNGVPTKYSIQPIAKRTSHYPDTDGRYAVSVAVTERQSVVRCFIEQAPLTTFPESGERFESMAFYLGTMKLSISVQAEFPPDAGQLLTNGIEIICDYEATFGGCWLDNLNDENDVPTYFGADWTM